jgi:hypothetical protein
VQDAHDVRVRPIDLGVRSTRKVRIGDLDHDTGARRVDAGADRHGDVDRVFVGRGGVSRLAVEALRHGEAARQRERRAIAHRRRLVRRAGITQHVGVAVAKGDRAAVRIRGRYQDAVVRERGHDPVHRVGNRVGDVLALHELDDDFHGTVELIGEVQRGARRIVRTLHDEAR